jgi:hypothetical protein
VSLVLVFLVIMPREARAELYGFDVVENNSGIAGTIATQLSVEVTDPGTTVVIDSVEHNQVLFTFSNTGSEASSITDLYFEDGSLLLLAAVLDNPPNVDFQSPPNPGNLPGWETLDPPFDATSDFSVDSNPPQLLARGVNPGESLGLLYTLQSGGNFADVIAALGLGVTNPDPEAPRDSLRIGLHVQGIGPNDEGDSFILMTPIPASVVLGILGLGVAGWKLRKYA